MGGRGTRTLAKVSVLSRILERIYEGMYEGAGFLEIYPLRFS
jgi:hypothetical protein